MEKTQPSEVLQGPLEERHRQLGASFAEFGGWLMPVSYAGTVTEHTATRDAVGLFDVSHLGKALVRGPGAAEYVNSALTNDLRRIGPGKAQYTLCCTDSGGVIDDLIAYYVSDDEIFLVPNAANTAAVVAALAERAPAGLTITDEHRSYAVLAVQGPKSPDVLGALGLATDMDYMGYVDAEFSGVPVRVCRTGYTGEHGYELLPPWDQAGVVFDALVDAVGSAGGELAGLGARDTLRTEMGYPLHGHELSLELSPLQARCGWAIGWKKDAFWGREALLAEKEAGPRRLLRGLKAVGRGVLRPDLTVLDGDRQVGVTTSGTFSPTLKVGIALALIDTLTPISPTGNACRSTSAAAPSNVRSSSPHSSSRKLGSQRIYNRCMTDGPLEFTVERNATPASDEVRASILANPGFGQFHTDHMVSIDYIEGKGWHDARVTPYGPIELDPSAIVLHYAQEIFEGLKAYRWADGSIVSFRPESNARRLRTSAQRLAIPELPEEVFIESLRQLIAVDEPWVPSAGGEESLYLRPFTIATEPGLGVRPANEYRYMVIASPAGAYFKGGIKPVSVWLSTEYVRACPGGTGAAKFGGNYAASLLAQAQAIENDCDQVVWLDAAERRYVEEMGGMNLFFVFGSGGSARLVTPELSGSILPGVTRDSLLQLATDAGFAVEERKIDVDEWQKKAAAGEITEVFACGTAAVITPVARVKHADGEFTIADGGPGEITMALRDTLTGIQRGTFADTHGWMARLS